jgi:CelD/BcsL family acetyltransferase involved in cellulose biosynthesis
MSSAQTLNRIPNDRESQALTLKLVVGQELPSELIDRATALDSSGPFGRAVWWDSWWRHLRPPGSELFLLTVSRGDQLLGIAPWYTRRTWSFGRVVRFLGDGRACSDYMTIAAAPGHRDEVWREVTRWVAAEAGKSWDTFILSGVSAADQSVQDFCEQVRQRGLFVDQRTVGNTWRVSLPESWEAYVELFSKQHRNRLRRATREMWDSGRAVLHRVTNLRDFERGFAIQHGLHQKRRQGLGDAGCFADRRFEAFLHEANRRLLEQGKLRLQWTEIDGEPVAFDSSYVDHEGVFVYQTAFDPAKSDLSPGRLHLQASILKAIEEGYRFFDFLRGDEPYKAHLRAKPIPLLETRLIAPRVLPHLGYRLWKLQKLAKSRMRRFIRRRKTDSVSPIAE